MTYCGPFAICDNLKTVTFEEGTTQVATNLFRVCTGIEEIIIPKTVTVPSSVKPSQNLDVSKQ